jgi:hypothetical protein
MLGTGFFIEHLQRGRFLNKTGSGRFLNKTGTCDQTGNEQAWWEKRKINALKIARELWERKRELPVDNA